MLGRPQRSHVLLFFRTLYAVFHRVEIFSCLLLVFEIVSGYSIDIAHEKLI